MLGVHLSQALPLPPYTPHCYLLEDTVKNTGGKEGTQEPAARELPCPCTDVHFRLDQQAIPDDWSP